MHSLPTKCTACDSTELALKKIPHKKVIMDDAMIEQYKNEGMAAAPVVIVEMGDGARWTWSGYRHTNIARLKVLFAEELAAAA